MMGDPVSQSAQPIELFMQVVYTYTHTPPGATPDLSVKPLGADIFFGSTHNRGQTVTVLVLVH